MGGEERKEGKDLGRVASIGGAKQYVISLLFTPSPSIYV